MKRLVSLLLLAVIAIIPLIGCSASGDPLSSTTSDTQVDTTLDSQTDTTLDTISSEATSATEDPYYPYLIHEIDDDRITVDGDKKTYTDRGITVSIPVDWACLESNGEDGGSYLFREPTLGDKCQFICGILISDLYTPTELTEEIYLKSNSYGGRTDVKVISLTQEMLSGYSCIKGVVSYSLEGTEYIEIDYLGIITGVRWYSFSITYPAAERETFEPVFESIVNSIELRPV